MTLQHNAFTFESPKLFYIQWEISDRNLTKLKVISSRRNGERRKNRERGKEKKEKTARQVLRGRCKEEISMFKSRTRGRCRERNFTMSAESLFELVKLSRVEKLRPLYYSPHDVGNIVEINELRRGKVGASRFRNQPRAEFRATKLR